MFSACPWNASGAFARQVVLTRVLPESRLEDRDHVAVEEPLEIKITFIRQQRRRLRKLAVTMRTPGHDSELATGFLWTEGLIRSPQDVLAVVPCRSGNGVRVHLRAGVALDRQRLKRHFYTTSSCGVCGKSSIEAVQVNPAFAPPEDHLRIPEAVIHQLAERARAGQVAFECTGGLHASALFSADGTLLGLREDVGRHNALDKLIGYHVLRKQLPLSASILMVSGRVSFELVQKGAMAGIPVLVAVGAPSSLAIDLAESRGMTLIGFARQNRFNIYCGKQRIDTSCDVGEAE
jgi:FdhD protein